MVRQVTVEERFHNYVGLFRREGEDCWSPYSDLPMKYYGVCTAIGGLYPCVDREGRILIRGLPVWVNSAICDAYWTTHWVIHLPEEEFLEVRQEAKHKNRDLWEFLGDRMMEEMKNWNRKRHGVVSGLY